MQERPLLVQTLHPINGITVDSVCYFLVFYLLISVYKKVFKFWIWNEVANMQNSNSNFNLTKISWTAMCRFYLESKGSSRQTLNMMSWHVWNVFCKELHALRGLSEYLQYNIKTIHHCWVSKLGPDSVRMVNTFKKTYKQTNKKKLTDMVRHSSLECLPVTISTTWHKWREKWFLFLALPLKTILQLWCCIVVVLCLFYSILWILCFHAPDCNFISRSGDFISHICDISHNCNRGVSKEAGDC